MSGASSSQPSPSSPQSSPPKLRMELIAAVAANGVIGQGGQLPWHLPDDLKRFKQLTTGHPIIMGRKTYESIGRPLPGRLNIVVSASLSSPPHPDVAVARSLDEAIRAAAFTSASCAFIIGGAALYAAALPHVDVMHLTEVDEAVDGDTCFPPFDRSRWRLVEEIDHGRDDRHAFRFRFRTYVRG